MPERTVVVASEVGLHARPARLFVTAAKEQAKADPTVTITIGKPGEEPVDATSPLLVMSLGVPGGQEVVLRAEGDGAEAALDALEAVLKIDHDTE